jgi:2-amino-4-hydroxy-6-hydroxymethyldihydropteridine diphosphokinase
MKTESVYFSLGSNLGDRRANILTAVSKMDTAFGVHYSSLSKIIETVPWGFFSARNFLNCVILYHLDIDSDSKSEEDACLEILRKCQKIEKDMGRDDEMEITNEGDRVYHDRIIDIDFLFCGTIRLHHQDLILPHPLIAQRDFVMLPLQEVAEPMLYAEFPDLFESK